MPAASEAHMDIVVLYVSMCAIPIHAYHVFQWLTRHVSRRIVSSLVVGAGIHGITMARTAADYEVWKHQ